MRFFGALLLTLLTGLSLFTGCQGEEACLSNQHAVQAGLYSAWSEADKDSTLQDLSLVGLDRIDSIYANVTISEVFMPLDFESDTSTFVIGVSETLKDTLSVVYQKELDFISRDCGYIFTFDIDTIIYTNAFIDSVAVDYPTVKYGETIENIKLYIY